MLQRVAHRAQLDDERRNQPLTCKATLAALITARRAPLVRDVLITIAMPSSSTQ